MIFLRYESFKGYIRYYPVTSVVLLVNTLLMVLMFVDGGSQNVDTLVRFGALVTHYEPYSSEVWRYFTSIFLHIGLDHWLFNSFAIFVFAPPLERIMGKLPYLILYIGSGLIGNIASAWLQTDVQVSAGASGAIYGIYGAFLFIGFFRKRLLDDQSHKTVLIILVIGVIYSVLIPHVSLLAHLGGAIGGFLLFPLLKRQVR
ncbi:rhomboid family intramembrane serine protease [Ferviditalea candida]|uniref:Rhomboid family intramembrane serine protease n=1 Tax=Ferviditalea candida TaxID=3108399 RepID=A0ABU5ZD96_9BACL|nr:rhomboid family intramembrane serine protease [Paenibacillaceae bacterium T2]